MAQQSIGQGEFHLVPDTEVKKYLCAGTVTKGDVVTSTGTTGYSIIICTDILPPLGVAAESGITGQWIDVVVSGFCDFLTCTATNIVEYDMLYVDASSDAAGVTYGDDLGVEAGGIFGVALEAEAGTTLTASIIYKHPQ